MDSHFGKWPVEKLKVYLKERGVTFSKRKKKELIELCISANETNLQVDPDYMNDNILDEINQKLLVEPGKSLRNPAELHGYSDMSSLPNIDRIDIYNYLINFKDNFDHKKIKAYKSLDGYQLYMAGYVQNLKLCKNVGIENYIVMKFQVQPKTRKEDPINNVPYYEGWIIIESLRPSIKGAYCKCKGGADGACRHVVAALFEIAQYAEEANQISVTSQTCQWTKKPKQNETTPTAISNLNIALPGSNPKVAPLPEFYDPCPTETVNVDSFYKKLKELDPNANILLNRYIYEELHPPEKINCDVPTILENTKLFKNLSISFIDFIKLSEEQRLNVEICTRGQSSNEIWSSQRQGRITASNFKRVFTLKDTTDPSNLVKHLIQGASFGKNIPASIEWGRKKETPAKGMFVRLHKLEHKSIIFEERGLVLHQDLSFIGASPDGYCKCIDCGEFLIEIKCPYTMRNFFPKQAAKERDCYQDENHIWHLKESSSYYYQIQGQLAVCKLNLCKLIIYTIKGIVVIDVEFCSNFWKKCEEKLIQFYTRHMVPKLLENE